MVVKHLHARLHRFVYGFFGKTDKRETQDIYAQVQRLLTSNQVRTNSQIEALADRIANDVIDTLRIANDDRITVRQFVRNVIAYEGLFNCPDIDFAETRTVAEYWALNEQLKELKTKLEKIPAIIDALANYTLNCFAILKQHLENVPDDDGVKGIAVQTRRIDRISDLPDAIEKLALSAFGDDLEELNFLTQTRRRLETNLVIASGGNPADIEGFSKSYRMPEDYRAKTPDELVGVYLAGTPLIPLFGGEEQFVIPQSARFEHHHIIAGTGHGKTQTLQYLICNDLDAVAAGERSVVVIDSQGDLIRKIANLEVFAPGQPLHDHICIIDPTDIEWPVSLNLFDVGQERLRDYPMLERERLTNSILELYDFVLGSLLSAEMTQKQTVIFRYVTRLMLHIPDATIHTLRELMEKESEIKFAEHIAKLEGTALHFFESEFPSSEFKQTRQQVLRRLWGILENQTFERMFSHPRSKLDLFSEMNSGKVILINTAKDLLKETGTEIFGRFFIAMIAQAAQERATLPENLRMPTMVYIDEAADYFDRNIGIILSQARKYKVGMILAHQYLGQLDPKLQEAFSVNTAIKFAGGFSGKEARAASQMLNCDQSLIESQPKGSFATYIRGVTPRAIPLQFPFGVLEKLPEMSSAEREDLRKQMRARYAVHYSELHRPKSDRTYDDDQDTNLSTGTGDAHNRSNETTPADDRNENREPIPSSDKTDPDNTDNSSGKSW